MLRWAVEWKSIHEWNVQNVHKWSRSKKIVAKIHRVCTALSDPLTPLHKSQQNLRIFWVHNVETTEILTKILTSLIDETLLLHLCVFHYNHYFRQFQGRFVLVNFWERKLGLQKPPSARCSKFLTLIAGFSNGWLPKFYKKIDSTTFFNKTCLT